MTIVLHANHNCLTGEATPHGHGFISLANMYQHHNLDEIRRMIEANRQSISPEQMLQRITHFVEHLQLGA